MKKKFILSILFSSVLFLIVRFNFGVFVHDEFLEEYIFLKHKPIWKWRFYSPIHQSDQKIENLLPEKQYEQKMFNEFVSDQGLSR
jgi:peptidoglycan hydrolase CwlO-like protein